MNLTPISTTFTSHSAHESKHSVTHNLNTLTPYSIRSIPSSITQILEDVHPTFTDELLNADTHPRPLQCLSISQGIFSLEGPIKRSIQIQFCKTSDRSEQTIIAAMPIKTIASVPMEIEDKLKEKQDYQYKILMRERMLRLTDIEVRQMLEKEKENAQAQLNSKIRSRPLKFSQLLLKLGDVGKELPIEAKESKPLKWETFVNDIKNKQNLEEFEGRLRGFLRGKYSWSYCDELTLLAKEAFQGECFELKQKEIIDKALKAEGLLPELKSTKNKCQQYPSSSCSSRGKRARMEDFDLMASFVFRTQDGQMPGEIRAIFDGHGTSKANDWTPGLDCSQFVSACMLPILINYLNCLCQKALTVEVSDVHIVNAIELSFLELNFRYQNFAGSTANVCLIINNNIYTANLGDSGAIFVKEDGSIIPLSREHKPDDLLEQDEINIRNGIVNGKRLGSLAMTRAFGDFNVLGVSAKPTIVKLPIENGKLLQFCDGISDVLTEEQMGKICRGFNMYPDVNSAEVLVKTAYFTGSLDNLSVIETSFNGTELWPIEESSAASIII